MRATSFRRTAAPLVVVRSTMLPNSSTVLSWPVTLTLAVIGVPCRLGSAPVAPAETWMFWLWMAETTLAEDSL